MLGMHLFKDTYNFCFLVVVVVVGGGGGGGGGGVRWVFPLFEKSCMKP